jgi:hypothetical protein
MKRIRRWQLALAMLACTGILLPQPVMAGTVGSSEQAATSIQDVALDAGGKLHGQVVDAEGRGIEGVTVHMVQDGQELAAGVTDTRGNFEMTGLRGGVYQMVTESGGRVYRVWSHRAAPPAASRGVMLVESPDVVRGQSRPVIQFLTNPWVLGGIAAAAIAIPLALDDDDDAS